MDNSLDTVTARSVGEVIAFRLLRELPVVTTDRVLVSHGTGAEQYVSWGITQGRCNYEPAAVKATVDLAAGVAQAPWETVPTETLRVLADGLLAMAEAR